jgi:hypothetical protein
VLDTAVVFNAAYKSYMTLVTGAKGVNYCRLGLQVYWYFRLFISPLQQAVVGCCFVHARRLTFNHPLADLTICPEATCGSHEC